MSEQRPGILRDVEASDPIELPAELKAHFTGHELPTRVRLGIAKQCISRAHAVPSATTTLGKAGSAGRHRLCGRGPRQVRHGSQGEAFAVFKTTAPPAKSKQLAEPFAADPSFESPVDTGSRGWA